MIENKYIFERISDILKIAESLEKDYELMGKVHYSYILEKLENIQFLLDVIDREIEKEKQC